MPSTAPGGAPIATAFSTACKVGDEPSDAPCRAPRRSETRTAYGEPGPFPPMARQRQRLSGFRAPSIDKCPLGLLSQGSIFCGNPPPISRLSHRNSASGACSPLVMLSHREARPNRVIRRLFARGHDGPRAACRLLQSKRTTSTDNGTFEPRAPHRWSPIGAALPAGGYAGSSRVSHPFERESLERGQSRGHRSGARGHRHLRPGLPRAPPIAIARGGSLAPT